MGGLVDTLSSINRQLEELRARLPSASGARPLPELLSIRQVARALGLSPWRTVAPLVRAGAIRSVTIGDSSRRRIPRSEVERIAREGVPSLVRPTRRKRTMLAPNEPRTQAEARAALKALGF